MPRHCNSYIISTLTFNTIHCELFNVMGWRWLCVCVPLALMMTGAGLFYGGRRNAKSEYNKVICRFGKCGNQHPIHAHATHAFWWLFLCLCWARATICHWKAREKKCHTAYITCCTSNKRSVFRVELGLLSLPLVSMVYYMRARVRRARNTRITQWMHNAVGISTNGQSWHWATAAATTKLWSPLIGHKGTSSIDETDAFEILTVRRESMNLRHYRYSKSCRIFNST